MDQLLKCWSVTIAQGPVYYHLVDVQIAGWLSNFLSVTKAVGAAFSAMVGQAAAARILMDMGRSSKMPKALSQVTERTGVPTIGVVAVAAFNVAIAVWAATQPGGPDTLVFIVDVGALTAFILLHASAIGYFYLRRAADERSILKHLVSPLIGAAILLAVIVFASGRAQIIGGGWLIIGPLIVTVQQREHHKT